MVGEGGEDEATVYGDEFGQVDLRRAVEALPAAEREHAKAALVCVLSLVEKSPRGRTPDRFVLGRVAWRDRALHWAARTLGYRVEECGNCPGDGVTLVTVDRKGGDGVHHEHDHHGRRKEG